MVNIRLIELRDVKEAVAELKRIGVDERGVEIMAPKALGLALKIENLSCGAANILKQTALSSGADAAIHRDVITGGAHSSHSIVFGNLRELESIGEKLRGQPFGLHEIGGEVCSLVRAVGEPGEWVLNLPKHRLDVSRRTHLMGALNVTPDSFSDGGLYLEPDRAVERAHQMAEEGADILDIGGESTRPGSDAVSPQEELRRVMPVVERLTGNLKIPLSIDTSKSEVAEEALSAGCEIVNDIAGLGFDPHMAETVAKHSAGLVIMHMKGTPKDMQLDPVYTDLMGEINRYLRERAQLALEAGVGRDVILIDPGIGFGKTVEHNLVIIRRLRELKPLGFPILIGPSRKSFIGKVLDLPVEDRLEGTLASLALSIANGANLVRVHDVRQASRTCKLVDAIVHSDSTFSNL